MKTIGLLGGMSWESSVEYYRVINQEVQRRLGGVHSAQSLMYSFDFGEIEALQTAGDWAGATQRMIEAARQLERGGADCLLICTNTMHLMADEVQQAINIPLIHIVDPTAAVIQQAGLSTVGLLGTRYTMEREFYRGRLESRYGMNVLIPDEEQRTTIHTIIYDELVRGVIRDESRQAYRSVITSLVERGAQGIILGCTEIGLLIKPEDSPVPVFDTARLHAAAAVDFALEQVAINS